MRQETAHVLAIRALAWLVSQESLIDGFLAHTLEEELPAAPGTRILVTIEVEDVTDRILAAIPEGATGKERYDAIETVEKALVAECDELRERRVRLIVSGETDLLPARPREALERAMADLADHTPVDVEHQTLAVDGAPALWARITRPSDFDPERAHPAHELLDRRVLRPRRRLVLRAAGLAPLRRGPGAGRGPLP